MKKLFIFAAVLPALLLTACSSDENLDEGTLQIIAGIGKTANGLGTRAVKTGAGFSTGEEIGIFITGTGYTSTATTFTKAEGSNWTGSAIYLTNNEATVYGYYPSTPSPNMTAFTVPATVLTTITGFDAASVEPVIDYMYAVGSDGTNQATVTKGSPTATLTFKHALVQLVFVIKRTPQFGGTGTLTNMTLTQPEGSYFNGGATEGTMALTNGTLSLPETETTISLTDSKTINESSGTDITARVLVAPANAAGISLSLTIDGASYALASETYLPTGSGETFTSWEAGKIYTYTINVGGGTLTMENTGVTISDWTNGPDLGEIQVE